MCVNLDNYRVARIELYLRNLSAHAQSNADMRRETSSEIEIYRLMIERGRAVNTLILKYFVFLSYTCM